MQLVGARLGEHFDASVAQLVILGRKRIAVDANLADGRLGRQLPAGESVDVNLPAIRSGCGPGQRLQLAGQLIRIVRQGVQILALDDDGVRVAAGFHIDRGQLVGHHHALLRHFDGHGNIHALDLPGCKRNRRGLKRGESAGAGLHNIAARRQSVHRVSAGSARRRCGHNRAPLAGDGNRGPWNPCAGWVGDVPAQCRGGRRGRGFRPLGSRSLRLRRERSGQAESQRNQKISEAMQP